MLRAKDLVKSYFSLFNSSIESKMRTKRLLLRKRRLSSNKIFAYNGEFKHTNNKIVLTLYIFNRQKSNYISALKNQYLTNTFFVLAKKSSLNNSKPITDLKQDVLKRLEFVNEISIHNLKKFNKDKYTVLKTIAYNTQACKTDNIDTILEKYSNLEHTLVYLEKNLYDNIYSFQKTLLNKFIRKLQSYMYYRQLIYINRSKFNYTYLQYLKQTLYEIFNKNIEFNIINTKRFYLNSDILAESIMLKLTKKRKWTVKYLKNLKEKVKYSKKKSFFFKSENIYLGNLIAYYKMENRMFERFLIKNLKYKDITGFKLQAKGRLTRRYTASRSMTKVKYSGNLINYDSSFNGLSTVLLKGNLNPNIQYTRIKSKSRIGSFGVKAWLSAN